MTCVRVTFEDGVIYDYPFSKEELSVLTKSECLIKALAIAEDWHQHVAKECDMPESFVSRVEWFRYNFTFNRK